MSIKMNKRVLVPYREAGRIAPYLEALRLGGLEPVAAETSGRLSLAGFDGLVLTGGVDVDPSLYGETPHPMTEEADPERDRIELELLREDLRLDLPVLAICRGMQLLNVAQGGTLHQHLESHQKVSLDRAEPVHPVSIESDSLLAGITGRAYCDVNSRHHQAVAELGGGLRITARAPDGVIEAVELPGSAFVVAVQWHPEDQAQRFPEQLALFAGFGDACAAHAIHSQERVETFR